MGEIRWVGPSWTGGADNAWHHYVLTRKGTALSFYRDGELAIANDHPENAVSLAPSDKELTIGSNAGGGQASSGFADDFRVYDRALLSEEVQGLYAICN